MLIPTQVLEPLLSTVYSRMKAYSVVTPSNPYVLDLVPANGRHVFATAVDSTDLWVPDCQTIYSQAGICTNRSSISALSY